MIPLASSWQQCLVSSGLSRWAESASPLGLDAVLCGSQTRSTRP